MSNNIEITDLRNLITSVTLGKALVKKFESKPFTVGSANSSVKMFSSLIALFEPVVGKLTMKEESLISGGLGKRAILSKINKKFAESFAGANEDEVLPGALVEETLNSYRKLLEALQVAVALLSSQMPEEVTSLSEREINIVDECRAVYNEYMKHYEEVGEAFHNAEHLQGKTSFEKELAIVENSEINLDLKASDDNDPNKAHISADFRVRD